MTQTTTTPDVPPPAGATSVGDWENGQVRGFYGTKRVVDTKQGRIEIELEGEQSADGEVGRRLIYVSPYPSGVEGPTDGPMAVEDARNFGAALIAAADEQAELAEQDERGTR